MNWKQFRRLRLTKHFWVAEFVPITEPKDLLVVKLENIYKSLSILCSLLEEYRVKYNTPFIILSGLRTPSTNSGYSNSYHLYGMACDFYPKKFDTIYDLAKDLYHSWLGGAGWYPQNGFIHVDIGFRRRWKRVDGEYLDWKGELEI